MGHVSQLPPPPVALATDPWERAVLTLAEPVDAGGCGSAGRPTPAQLRTVLAGLDKSRAVVTADVAGAPVGFACTSFAVLSVNPPLITVFPARTSLTWPQIRRVGRFCINLLPPGRSGHFERFSRMALDRFEGVPWTTSPGGCPVLQGVDAWIQCDVSAEHAGGDHRIVVAAVSALATDLSGLPPLFFRSSYGSS